MAGTMRAVGTIPESEASPQPWRLTCLTHPTGLRRLLTILAYTDIQGGKGAVDALFINPETPKPVPAAGQAIVKIKAFGINRMDIIQRNGNYPVPPQAPATLGVEFAGHIESFGDGEHGSFKIGDEVFGLAYGGRLAA
ncbi:hypothetical protein NQ176_g6987 [Zarea fungicola]|uniref:Uncharacterized protein n=1 Tax=Zarea fungicola TaxID=93591 RepID=A0ACC1N1L6_9HYPO|nr:hypothetical protein NQ176_g6987 [Lecanicillium fungicola]